MSKKIFALALTICSGLTLAGPDVQRCESTLNKMGFERHREGICRNQYHIHVDIDLFAKSLKAYAHDRSKAELLVQLVNSKNSLEESLSYLENEYQPAHYEFLKANLGSRTGMSKVHGKRVSEIYIMGGSVNFMTLDNQTYTLQESREIFSMGPVALQIAKFRPSDKIKPAAIKEILSSYPIADIQEALKAEKTLSFAAALNRIVNRNDPTQQCPIRLSELNTTLAQKVCAELDRGTLCGPKQRIIKAFMKYDQPKKLDEQKLLEALSGVDHVTPNMARAIEILTEKANAINQVNPAMMAKILFSKIDIPTENLLTLEGAMRNLGTTNDLIYKMLSSIKGELVIVEPNLYKAQHTVRAEWGSGSNPCFSDEGDLATKIAVINAKDQCMMSNPSNGECFRVGVRELENNVFRCTMEATFKYSHKAIVKDCSEY